MKFHGFFQDFSGFFQDFPRIFKSFLFFFFSQKSFFFFFFREKRIFFLEKKKKKKDLSRPVKKRKKNNKKIKSIFLDGKVHDKGVTNNAIKMNNYRVMNRKRKTIKKSGAAVEVFFFLQDLTKPPEELGQSCNKIRGFIITQSVSC